MDFIFLKACGSGRVVGTFQSQVGVLNHKNMSKKFQNTPFYPLSYYCHLKAKKSYICNFRGSAFLIWVNFSFLENSEHLEPVISIVKIYFPYQYKRLQKQLPNHHHPYPSFPYLSPIPISIPITKLIDRD